MTGLLRFFIRHPTASNLLMALVVALGLAAGANIRAQYFPDVVSETITVRATWDGASAADIDQAMIARIEAQVLSVEGVSSVRSTARTGAGTINAEFEAGWPMDRAFNDVSAAVDSIADFPEDAEPPTVRRGGWRDTVAEVVISGPTTTERLSMVADDMIARLFRAGVTRTEIRGRTPSEILVDVSDDALRLHGVTRADVAAAIRTVALPQPAGELLSVAMRLRTGDEKRKVDEIKQLSLTAGTGGEIALGDIARVYAKTAREERTFFNGDDPAISIIVERGAEGDTIAIQETLERTAAELTPLLPEGVSIALIQAEAGQITQRLDLLFENGAIGLALVFVLLFCFLSARAAFWVAAGIPVALAAAVGLMLVTGQTLNMISLFMLIVCLGIIVDDAIVVAEHADFRVRRLGETPVRAAERAARRMAAPVFAAMVTTAIAFAALTLVGGRFGVFIAAIPFVVVVVLIASLVECFLILPHHMARSMRAPASIAGRPGTQPGARTAWLDRPSAAVNALFDRFRNALFRPAMGLVITLRYPVMAACVLGLALSVAAVMQRDVPWRFFSAPEGNSITGNVAMLPVATRADTMDMMRETQRAVSTVSQRYEAEHGRRPVVFALAEIGGSSGRGLSAGEGRTPDHLAAITIELIDADLRTYSTSEVLSAIQREIQPHPLAETISFRTRRRGPQGDSLDVSLYGAAPETLKAAAVDLQARLSQYPEVSALEDDLAYDKIEQVLTLTPLGAALGVTLDDVNEALRERLTGLEAASYPDGRQTGRILVRAPPETLKADFFERTEIALADGGWVTLSEIVEGTDRLGFSTLRRENGLVRVKVSGDLAEDDPVVAEAIGRDLVEVILPDIAARHGVSWLLGGLAEQEEAFLDDAVIGAIACVLGIYLSLAWILGSWTRPSVIMLTIPFGLIGAILGHAAWELPLSIFSVIGLIGMAGIIVNDSIVLVTTIQDYARRAPLRRAVLDAAADRLRPVLLTTLTTVVGMAPLLYEESRQALFLKPTVITLCYGLGFGMVLVLLIVPAAVMIEDDCRRIVRSARRGLRGPLPRRTTLALWGLGAACIAGLAATLGHHAATGMASTPVAAVARLLGTVPDLQASVAAALVCVFAAVLLALAATLRVGSR
ncbi:MAG: efflux RND transporter permease subunit [Pseudomonadota bacterium]